MAHHVYTGAADVSGSVVTLHGSWDLFVQTDGSSSVWFDYGPGALSFNTNFVSVFSVNGSWQQNINPTTARDTTWYYQARSNDDGGNFGGDILSFKSFADVATLGTPSASAITQTTATVSCFIVPNVVESTGDISVFYKKSTDVSYTQVSVAIGQQNAATYSKGLTGLLPGTTYDYFFRIVRNTQNAITADSSVVQFTTRAAQTVVTSAATAITAGGAQLNGTVNAVSSANSVTYYFQWGLTAGYGNYTSVLGPTSSTVDVIFSALISGLVANTVYHFRAVAITSEYAVVGIDRQFTTGTGDPAVLRL